MNDVAEELAPIATPDPRLLPHLEPGEQVLWQGSPEFAGLFATPKDFATLGTLVALGLGYPAYAGFLDRSVEAFVNALPIGMLPLGVAAAIVLFRRWVAGATLFALTDRRAIEVRGRRLMRSDEPEKMGEVRVLPSVLGRHGTVAWREERVAAGTEQVMGREETRYEQVPVGFQGLAEPQRVAALVGAWRQQGLRRAAARAAAEARRIGGATAGFTIAAPKGWGMEVSSTQGTGAALSNGRWYRLSDPADGWTALRLIAPGGPELRVIAGEGPPPLTLAEARDADWVRLFRARVFAEEPEMGLGPWRGFAVTHRVPGRGSEPFSVETLLRRVWLDCGGRHLLVQMEAPAANLAAQDALEAVAQTLGPA